MLFRLFVFLALCIAAAPARADSWTPLAAREVNQAAAAMVSVYCRIPDTQRAWVSSGVVIRSDDPAGERRGEVVITTAHGVGAYGDPSHDNCFVVGPDGAHYRVIRTFNPPTLSSSWDDWAVVVTDQPFVGPATRLPVREIRAVQGEVPVAMVGRDYSNPDCHLERSDRVNDGGRLIYTHTCGSRRGLSGAPIIARVDGEVAVIAINVGRLTGGAGPGQRAIARGVGDGFDAMIQRGIEASQPLR